MWKTQWNDHAMLVWCKETNKKTLPCTTNCYNFEPALRLLKTCTCEPAHMDTAVRTHWYIQQTHSACTDEALVRVYRWGPWPRVQTRPFPFGWNFIRFMKKNNFPLTQPFRPWNKSLNCLFFLLDNPQMFFSRLAIGISPSSPSHHLHWAAP